MTAENEAPAPDTKAKGVKSGPNYTAEQKELAFTVWKIAGCPSFDDLAVLVKACCKFSVDSSTLIRWKDQNPEWMKAWFDHKNPLNPEAILKALQQAKKDAKALDPDHLAGIKTALIARLYISLGTVELRTVEEWERALGCCDKLEALIHTERGKAVAEKQNGKHVSLVSALTPPVTVAPFKKANGANGTNGGSH